MKRQPTERTLSENIIWARRKLSAVMRKTFGPNYIIDDEVIELIARKMGGEVSCLKGEPHIKISVEYDSQSVSMQA